MSSQEQERDEPVPTHVTLEQAEKARDRAYHQGRQDAEAEAQKAKDARWMTSLDKIDTIQARAQIEALRRIAEELHTLNGLLQSGEAAETMVKAVMDAPVPEPK